MRLGSRATVVVVICRLSLNFGPTCTKGADLSHNVVRKIRLVLYRAVLLEHEGGATVTINGAVIIEEEGEKG